MLRYAGDFIPSWAGAISIDLMPAVLVLILCVVHAAIRREGLPVASASSLTASDLVTALQIAREVEDARRAAEARPVSTSGEPAAAMAVEPPAPAAAAAGDENVTSLSSARIGK